MVVCEYLLEYPGRGESLQGMRTRWPPPKKGDTWRVEIGGSLIVLDERSADGSWTRLEGISYVLMEAISWIWGVSLSQLLYPIYCSPVCDIFTFVSSNMRATMRPSRLSRHCWYWHFNTFSTAAFHSKESGTQHVAIPIFNSICWTARRSFLCLSCACRRAVSTPRDCGSGSPNVAGVITLDHTMLAAVSFCL